MYSYFGDTTLVTGHAVVPTGEGDGWQPPGAGALPVFYNMDAAKVFISMRNFSRFLFGLRVASFLRPESWV